MLVTRDQDSIKDDMHNVTSLNATTLKLTAAHSTHWTKCSVSKVQQAAVSVHVDLMIDTNWGVQYQIT